MDLSDIQGLVLHAYRRLPYARYVLLRFTGNPSSVRAWLGALVPSIDSAEPKDVGPSGRPGVRVNIAFTSTGLEALGLDPDARRTFPLTFLDGLGNAWPNPEEPDRRSRILGDVGDSAPDRWDWGYQGRSDVDALLLVFATDERALDAEVDRWVREARTLGAIDPRAPEAVERLSGAWPSDPNEPTREAFGFVDGISQPVLMGATGKLKKRQALQPSAHEVDDGEFLLGHRDGSRRVALSPTIRADRDPQGWLPLAHDDPKRVDLGYNGTYLVFRQLAQDVTAFTSFCEDENNRPGIPEDRFKALLVGRWQDGAPLITCPIAHDERLMRRPPSANDFTYSGDPDGERCPIGAHIRRTNPRDSLGENEAESWQIANRHRIIRRGRPYQVGADQGLQFICLNADIDRQFEFIQQNWINDATFDGLDGEDDPLVGARQGHAAAGHVTLPPSPEGRLHRRATGLPRFVTVKGGAYFFLPSLKALHYLAGSARVVEQPETWEPAPTSLSWADWVRFRVLARCPLALITALALLPLTLLGGAGLSALVRNMFIVSAREMALVSAMAAIAAAVSLTTYRVVQFYSEERFDVPPPGPMALTWPRMLRWQAATLPLLVTIVWMSITDRLDSDVPASLVERAKLFATGPAVGLGATALVGHLGAFMLLTLAEGLRNLPMDPDSDEDTLLVPPAPWFLWLRTLPSITSRLPGARILEGLASQALAVRPPFAAGYVDREKGCILPGHLANLALVLALLVVYVIGWIWAPLPPGDFRMPSLVYVLFLLTATAGMASGVAFFLDRFRVPLTFVLAAWLAIAWISKSSDHEFPVGDVLGPAPTALDVLEKADLLHATSTPGSSPIIVIAVGGGGIHQTAWTARVLTGLAEMWGTRFTENVRLISGSSAGSVGAMYFVNAYTAAGLPSATLPRIVESAESPALSEIWWGLAYPDLLRAVLPAIPTRWLSGTYDRAWAMEQAWQHAMRLPAGTPPPTMGGWRKDVTEGWRPAVAFNATIVETGERVALATYQISAPPPSQEPQTPPKTLDAITANHDLAVVTAARLSAAFPYVTPVARASSAGPDQMFHLTDGGFWDNSGVVTALEWLEAVRPSAAGRPVLLIEIPPQPQGMQLAQRRSWVWQQIAPATAFLSVRINGQRVRDEFELRMFKERWQRENANVEMVSARIPYNGPGASLSWQLSTRERCAVERAWGDGGAALGAEALARIERVLGPPDPVARALPEACRR